MTSTRNPREESMRSRPLSFPKSRIVLGRLAPMSVLAFLRAVPVLAQHVDVQKSTIVAGTPSAPAADGSGHVTITVTLKDGSGTPIAGERVHITPGSATGVTFGGPYGSTDTAGVVTFTARAPGG